MTDEPGDIADDQVFDDLGPEPEDPGPWSIGKGASEVTAYQSMVQHVRAQYAVVEWQLRRAQRDLAVSRAEVQMLQSALADARRDAVAKPSSADGSGTANDTQAAPPDPYELFPAADLKDGVSNVERGLLEDLKFAHLMAQTALLHRIQVASTSATPDELLTLTKVCLDVPAYEEALRQIRDDESQDDDPVD